MKQGVLKFTLLGTGSSGGVPRLGNDWGDCDPSESKNRRFRCSALAELFENGETKPTRLLIDTSPDLRQQLLREGIDRVDAIAISHDHADQTHGLDDIRVLAMRSRSTLDIYMDEYTNKTLTKKFNYCFVGKGGYPAILRKQPDLIDYETRGIHGPAGTMGVTPLRQQHGRITSLGFRIGDLAYCNDVNHLPDQTLEYLQSLEVLIVDALRYSPHPTHAHLERTLSWITKLKPKRAILTNLHIDMDYATLKRELPHNVEPGYDGMSVILNYNFP